MSESEMNVLITGGGGFIGSHLVEDQLRRGRTVTALDLDLSSLQRCDPHPHLRLIQGDICDNALVQQALAGIDLVFHLASAHLSLITPEQGYWDVNVKAAEELVRLSRMAGVKRFIHCSSVGIYGNIINPPANEQSPCHPELVYEQTKLAGEQALCRFYDRTGYPLSIVRPAWVYGPRCPRTAKLFRAIRKRHFVMVGNGQTQRHCVYISDLVDGLNLCAERDEAVGQTFIIGDHAAVTVQQLVEEIASIMQVPPPWLKVPVGVMAPMCRIVEAVWTVRGKEPPLSQRSLRFFTSNTSCDITKAKTTLQFSPRVSLKDGLQRTYASLQREGSI
jgi:nucleoside-diphosphate-sugar epimerase